MSFSKPKAPPAPPPSPTSEELTAKRVKEGEAAQVDWAKARAAGETDVGGALMRIQGQLPRGQKNMERRNRAYETLLSGSRG